jgi:hypothetical protein
MDAGGGERDVPSRLVAPRGWAPARTALGPADGGRLPCCISLPTVPRGTRLVGLDRSDGPEGLVKLGVGGPDRTRPDQRGRDELVGFWWGNCSRVLSLPRGSWGAVPGRAVADQDTKGRGKESKVDCVFCRNTYAGKKSKMSERNTRLTERRETGQPCSRFG